jgi:hypothetical protein
LKIKVLRDQDGNALLGEEETAAAQRAGACTGMCSK